MLQCVAVCCSDAVSCSVLQCVAVCCSVLQCISVGARMYPHVCVHPCVTMHGGGVWCVAVCCSVL